MQVPMLLKTLNPDFQDKVRHIFLTTLESSSGLEDLEVREARVQDDLIYGAHQLIIIISSEKISTTIKTNFSTPEVGGLEERLRKASPVDKVSTLDAFKGFFAEFNNEVAGYISRYYESNGLTTGLYLPFYAPGFSEAVSSDEVTDNTYLDYFSLGNGQFEITCSVSVTTPDIHFFQAMDASSFDQIDAMPIVLF